jgi:hypothetical protein
MQKSEIVKMMRERVGQEFDGEATFSAEEVAAITASLSVEQEPYGHWVKHRLADGVFLPKVCYIPTGPDYTVVPLYAHPPTPVSPPARDEEIERLKGEIEAARIGDAVLSWLVKFDLADAGNEYRAEDVVNILNELAPVSQPQSDRSVSGDAVRVKDNWLHLDELKREGVFPREVLVAAWNGESYTISQACAFEDGSFRWCWETDLDETVSDDGFEIHSWQPLPDAPRSALPEEGRNEP